MFSRLGSCVQFVLVSLHVRLRRRHLSTITTQYFPTTSHHLPPPFFFPNTTAKIPLYHLPSFIVAVCLSGAIVSLAAVHENKDEPLNALMNLVVGMGTFVVIVFIVMQCLRTVLWITAKNDVFQNKKHV